MQALAAHSRPGALIIAGIETALGVADARILLTGELSGAYFGAEDYIADIGGRRSPGGDEVLYARSQVCLAAYLAGIPAIDQVVTDIASDGQFLADARRGQALGYQGKMCIHPRQIGLAHEVFTPTPEEAAHARAVVAAGAEGVGVVGGQMVDEVHVRMARAVLARAAGPAGPGGIRREHGRDQRVQAGADRQPRRDRAAGRSGLPRCGDGQHRGLRGS